MEVYEDSDATDVTTEGTYSKSTIIRLGIFGTLFIPGLILFIIGLSLKGDDSSKDHKKNNTSKILWIVGLTLMILSFLIVYGAHKIYAI